MTPSRFPILLFLLSSACAGARGGHASSSPATMHQADERIPPISAFKAGQERNAYNAALAQEQQGWQLESAGDTAGARPSLEAAAHAYLAFVDRHPKTGWNVALRYHAADLLRRAGDFDEAASVAEMVANDPSASQKTKAMAWLEVANAQVGAKKLEPIQIAPASEREGAQAQPRQTPEAWKRFSDAADAFLQSPEASRPEPKDHVFTNGQLALVAARVAYAFDDMDGARRRLAMILDRWPDEPRVFEGAAPLYVQSFLAAKDYDGAQGAMNKVGEIARAQMDRATAQDARSSYEKTLTETGRAATTVRYEQARALLDQGKAAEAAKAFESLADENSGDTSAALVGAAIAYDRAGDPDHAAELRRRVVEQHSDAKVAPGAALQLAAYLSKKGDHAASAQVYETHVDKWPDDPNHCTALRNGAVELDLAKKDPAAAADQYRAFASDGRCAQASPDVAALAYYRAGQLYMSAKKRAEARDAFQAAADVQGVSTPDAKARVADAKKQARQLGTAAGRRPSR
jgi:tetratricopeptide (TPR) repeat protein